MKGDVVLFTNAHDIGKTFFFGIESDGGAMNAFYGIFVMIQQVFLKKTHADETHTNVTAEQAFRAFFKDMIGHALDMYKLATRTTHAFLVDIHHVLPDLRHEHVRVAILAMAIFRA